jgi:glycerol-3-phosphate dehydrogenase (NAD(P)+)
MGHQVSLYGRKTSARMQRLIETRCNDYIQIGDDMKLITDLDHIHESDYVVISVATQSLHEVVRQLAELGLRDKIIVLCMKGIEISTGRRLTQIVADELCPANEVTVWLGPGHVQEFYRGVPNCMVIDSDSEKAKYEIVENFSSDLIRFYYGMDLIGNEVGGAAKNVIGIAAGMLDGLDLSSLKGALMSRGTREISRLIVAMGGKEETVYGLCHLGDYEATLFSDHSHNRAFGKSVVKKEAYGKLAEGYYTVKALCNIGQKLGVELPICEGVYKILYENADPKEELKQLFARNLRNEFWS